MRGRWGHPRRSPIDVGLRAAAFAASVRRFRPRVRDTRASSQTHLPLIAARSTVVSVGARNRHAANSTSRTFRRLHHRRGLTSAKRDLSCLSFELVRAACCSIFSLGRRRCPGEMRAMRDANDTLASHREHPRSEAILLEIAAPRARERLLFGCGRTGNQSR